MLSDAVIPNYNSTLGPLHAGLEVGSVGEVVVQELEECIRLFLFQADNISGDYSIGGNVLVSFLTWITDWGKENVLPKAGKYIH